MKPSRRITSRRTTSRRARRDAHGTLAHEDLAAPVPQHAPGASEDQLAAIAEFYTPLSLKTGAGRQYWDEVLRLLVNIRADCDAAAERLGYASHKDDGLAAVEYIANKVLEAVRGERRQRQQQTASVQKPSATRPPEGFNPSRGDYETNYKPENRIRRAGHPQRAKLIDDLKQMLRERKTKSGVIIDPQLAHEIAKHVTTLNEGMAVPETTESIERMRKSIGPFLARLSGSRKMPSKQASEPASKAGSKAPAAAVVQKRKPPKRSLSRPNKAVTKPAMKGSKKARSG
jgi:hypothetical protein